MSEKSACACGGAGKWILIVLALAVVGVMIAKNAGKTPAVIETTGGQDRVAENTPQGDPLPRLVDLGATQCIPCKMMAPILQDLKKTYAGRLDVQFIDVWENPDAGKKYGINVIPTQIFYDAQGKELFRHEGFFGKDDILAKWKGLGVELAQNPEVGSQNPE
jgi:thioredoxin 1